MNLCGYTQQLINMLQEVEFDIREIYVASDGLEVGVSSNLNICFDRISSEYGSHIVVLSEEHLLMFEANTSHCMMKVMSAESSADEAYE